MTQIRQYNPHSPHGSSEQRSRRNLCPTAEWRAASQVIIGHDVLLPGRGGSEGQPTEVLITLL
jgi:hypothetical protein